MDNNTPIIYSLLTTLGLPVHYELFLHSGLETPCISYQETGNTSTQTGDTMGYSRVNYTIKVWGDRIKTLTEYAVQIDALLRPKGWRRTGYAELTDPNSSMIQIILNYEGLCKEAFFN